MRSIIVSLAFCVLIAFVGIASGAQAPQVPATIQEVFVDFTNQSITIEGNGFNTTVQLKSISAWLAIYPVSAMRISFQTPRG
jgi:hypothetical protein